MTLEACYAQMEGDCGAALAVLGSEARVRRYLRRFAEDPTARLLFAALRDGRLQDAFRAAHTLKGLCLGLGLTRLHLACSALTEGLRTGGQPEGQLVRQAEADYRHVISAICDLEEV